MHYHQLELLGKTACIVVQYIYAPINIMPHYPPPGLCRGKGGAFDLF